MISAKELDDRWRALDPAGHAEAAQKAYEGKRSALDAIVAEMLIGQAAIAFERFFGVAPPRKDGDVELRRLLTA